MWTVRDATTKKVVGSASTVAPPSGQLTKKPAKQATTEPNGNGEVSRKRKAPDTKAATNQGDANNNKRRKAGTGGKSKGKGPRSGESSSKGQTIEGTAVSFNEIPWSQVQTHESFLKGDEKAAGGFLFLEEIDGVDVAYETGAGGGKMISFKKVKEHEITGQSAAEAEDIVELMDPEAFVHIDDFEDDGSSSFSKDGDDGADFDEDEGAEDEEDAVVDADEEVHDADEDVASPHQTDEAEIEEIPELDMSAWDSLHLAPELLKGLQASGFNKPTLIQEKTLPVAIGGTRDIIGAAQTGSGKTLAFGLPILQSIATRVSSSKDNGLHALVLTPTRELALQVAEHMTTAAKFTPARIITLVGGISIPKQKRLISMKPDVIVATPGRLWELASENDDLLARLRGIKFLAIDEADRMLETGHFKDLDNILNAISMKRKEKPATRRTFIFSATLVNNAQMKEKVKQSHRRKEPTLQNLLARLEFQDAKPCYVNCLTEQVTADKLLETRIDCLHTEKDAYLYYILARYPGRTIVFVNSIDAIRRLVPVLTHMKIRALALHAEMQQRQRLKNLDRFKSLPDAVLIASDVAARGLDIPNIEHVVHYQLPRTADLYVHRSGRTARAAADGVSVMLCSPQEVPVYKKICHVLKKEDGIPEFPVDRSLLTGIKQRINLARKIDEAEHSKQKTQHEKNWFKKAAEEMDIVLDEDFIGTNAKGTKVDKESGNKEALKHTAKVQTLKDQLNALLVKDLIPKGISGNYITGNTGADEDLPSTLMKASATSKVPTKKATKASQEVRRSAKPTRTKRK